MSAEHAPVGTAVRVITEGFRDHEHHYAIGDEGVVIGHVDGWADVRVGSSTQVLDVEDYEVIR